MKKFVLIVIVVLSVAKVWGQNYKVRNINADDAIAGFVEEIVSKNIKPDSHQYEFVLSQNGESFSFEYNVSPDGIKGVAKTDDVWNELETTVLKAIQNIRAEMTPKVTEPAKQSARQSVQQQPEQQQPEQQQIVQQQLVQQQIVQQQPTQQYQNQTQSVPNNTLNYNNMASQDYGTPYFVAGTAALGGLVRFSDGTQGIIFFLDGQGHGLVVSLDQTEMQWQNAKDERRCVDIYQILNESSFSKYCNVGMGMQNTQYIVTQLGQGQAPAAEWCLRHGNGWYLPSVGELWQLIGVADKVDDKSGSKGRDKPKGFISTMLEMAGGAPIDGWWYWTSSEENKENAYNISSSGRVATEVKSEENYVRAIRAF